MTVVLDWKSADWTVPKPPARCTMCGERVHPPFVHWQCSSIVGPEEEFLVTDIFICARCCHWTRSGLMEDMRRADAINEGLKPPPDCPTLRVAQ